MIRLALLSTTGMLCEVFRPLAALSLLPTWLGEERESS